MLVTYIPNDCAATYNPKDTVFAGVYKLQARDAGALAATLSDVFCHANYGVSASVWMVPGTEG